MCVARHAQSPQNNKFSISLENCKKNVIDEVDFKPAYKHQRIFQVDTIILGFVAGHVQITQDKKWFNAISFTLIMIQCYFFAIS